MAYMIRLRDARLMNANSTFDIQLGSKVIVNVDGILEYGTVEHEIKSNDDESVNTIVRIANDNDIAQVASQTANEVEDKALVQKMVQKDDLKLKLVAVLRSFDNKKLLIMYTAEDRVDFRMLVRELASAFKMRIEMRQISEREEASFLGGCGVCGQQICCRRFLSQPKQTTIKMAKLQGQALTPNKINGICGKIMCCMQYEFDQYQDILDKMPAIGTTVVTPDGEGVVEYNDCLRELVAVKMGDVVQKYSLDDILVSKSDSVEVHDE